MGSVAAQLILAVTAYDLAPDKHAVVRWGIFTLSQWLLLPSLVLVLLSGLATFGLHRAFHDAPWAWMKAVLTVAVLEGTLVAVQGPARRAAELSQKLADGEPTVAAALDEALRHERGGLWVIMGLCALNIGLAIWRPKFRWMRPR